MTTNNLYPLLNKEMHFFDKNYKRGAGWYTAWMPARPEAGSAAAQTGPTVSGEATPFYIAEKKGEACERIAAQLPDAKVIVLVREPVARAYSEYQMKARRVATQNDFLEKLSRHARARRVPARAAGQRQLARAAHVGGRLWGHS